MSNLEKKTEKIKRPLNAFMLYSQDHREELKKKGLKSTEITKKLSEQWAELSSLKKVKYEEQARVARGHYNELTGKTKKEEKKKNTPKRPLNAYMIFTIEQRPNISEESGLQGKELNKKLGEIWNEMTKHEKAPYEESAKEERIKYHAIKESQKSSSSKSISSEKSKGQALLGSTKQTKSLNDSKESNESKASKPSTSPVSTKPLKKVQKGSSKKHLENSGSLKESSDTNRLYVMKSRKDECVINSTWQ